MSASQTARLDPEVRRMLLTIQYERKMAGEALSFNDIIRQALEHWREWQAMGGAALAADRKAAGS